MRTLAALALVFVASGCSERADVPAAFEAAPETRTGPDPIALRIPRAGGVASAYRYPALDSAIWVSEQGLPALGRILAFDAENGILAVEDSRGVPGHLELRFGQVSMHGERLLGLASATAGAVFGFNQRGVITRVTRTGAAWTYRAPAAPRHLLPVFDGSLFIVAAADTQTRVWRIVPPDTALLDSARLPAVSSAMMTQVGDRLYFVTDTALLALNARGLQPVRPMRFREPVRFAAPTPSGDRIYVVTGDSSTVEVLDRYRERMVAQLELPGRASALRMDPLGRYLLVRTAGGDSLVLVSLSSDRFTGPVATPWRWDLPAVTADGGIAMASGSDVVIADASTLEPVRRITGGASDRWYFFRWNGFRPRAAGIDQPVEFEITQDTVEDPFAFETGPLAREVPIPAPATQEQMSDTAVAPPVPTAPRREQGWLVSFATLLNEDNAHALAREITVEGQRARVVTGTVAGAMLYRVVLGPYADRRTAERIGAASGRQFWVFEPER